MPCTFTQSFVDACIYSFFLWLRVNKYKATKGSSKVWYLVSTSDFAVTKCIILFPIMTQRMKQMRAEQNRTFYFNQDTFLQKNIYNISLMRGQSHSLSKSGWPCESPGSVERVKVQWDWTAQGDGGGSVCVCRWMCLALFPTEINGKRIPDWLCLYGAITPPRVF